MRKREMAYCPTNKGDTCGLSDINPTVVLLKTKAKTKTIESSCTVRAVFSILMPFSLQIPYM